MECNVLQNCTVSQSQKYCNFIDTILMLLCETGSFSIPDLRSYTVIITEIISGMIFQSVLRSTQ